MLLTAWGASPVTQRTSRGVGKRRLRLVSYPRPDGVEVYGLVDENGHVRLPNGNLHSESKSYVQGVLKKRALRVRR